MLLRRWRRTGILQRGVLGYVLPQLLFLLSYGVFHCSILMRVVIVFRDITYVIIIFYSWHLVICEHFGRMCGTIDPESCIRWVLGFGIKAGYDRVEAYDCHKKQKFNLRMTYWWSIHDFLNFLWMAHSWKFDLSHMRQGCRLFLSWLQKKDMLFRLS
jgi:hypothetical protein